MSVWRGARAADRDWRGDALCIQTYLNSLHEESAMAAAASPSKPISSQENVEMTLISRWNSITREMMVPVGAFLDQDCYTANQLRYLATVSDQLLIFKKCVLQDRHSNFITNLLQVTCMNYAPVENLIHLLAIALDQARDLFLNWNAITEERKKKGSIKETDSTNIIQNVKSYKSKKIMKMKDFYDLSSACLIDAIRRDAENLTEELSEDMGVVKILLRTLYRASKEDKKYLGPVLKPYLELIYITSYENCWFIEEFTVQHCKKELKTFQEFCQLVNISNVDPCELVLSLAPKYSWAKALVDFMNHSKCKGVRMVFPRSDGSRQRFAMKLPRRNEARVTTLTSHDKSDAKMKLAHCCIINAFDAALDYGNVESEDEQFNELPTSSKSEEFLSSRKNGQFWRNNTKPDLVTSSTLATQSGTDLNNLKKKEALQYSSAGNLLTMKKKYHTLKNLVYSGSVDSVGHVDERPKSAGNTLRHKQPMSRPTILETLDFINGVKNALNDDSGISDAEERSSEDMRSDHALVRDASPLAALASRACVAARHRALANLVPALISMHKFTVLQELCASLRSRRVRLGALYGVQRLARARRPATAHRPRAARHRYTIAVADAERLEEPRERYRLRPPDYASGEEAREGARRSGRDRTLERKGPLNDTTSQTSKNPPYKKESRESARDKWLYDEIRKCGLNANDLKNNNHNDYYKNNKSKRNVVNENNRSHEEKQSKYNNAINVTDLNIHKSNLNDFKTEKQIKIKSRPKSSVLNNSYTGIIDATYEEKRQKFTDKRSKSLGRSFSGTSKRTTKEATRYNITLGPNTGNQINTTSQMINSENNPHFDYRSSYFQRNISGSSELMTDSFHISKVIIH